MLKKEIINTLVLIFTLIICALYFRSYIDAVKDDFGQYVVKCADFGQYLAEVRKYKLPGGYFKEIVSLGKEPGYITAAAIISHILAVSEGTSMIILDFIVHLLTLLIIYIIASRLANKKIGTIVLFLAATSHLLNITYIFLFSRQEYANLSLLLLCLVHTSRTNGKIVISGIFVGMAIFGHRISMILVGMSFIISIIINFFQGNKRELRKDLLVIFAGLIFAGPYLFLQMGAFVDTITWYLKSVLGETSSGGSSNAAKSAGFDFFTFSGNVTEIPIIHYVKYTPAAILCISTQKFWLQGLNKNFKFMLGLYVVLILYTTTKLFFGMRFIISLDILFLISVTHFFQQKNLKFIKILSFIFLILLGIYGANGRLNFKIIRTVKFDSSLEEVKKYADLNTYWFGSGCTLDLGTQLGYGSPFTVPHRLWDPNKKNDEEGHLNMYVGSLVASTLSKSILEKPYLYEFYKDKKIWIIYSGEFDKDDIKKIASGNHASSQNENINKIFNFNNPKSYIRYIFEIKEEKITFFDSLNYLEKTLK